MADLWENTAGPSDPNVTESTPLLRHNMGEKNIGISQQTLVSRSSVGDFQQANRIPQYVAGLAATLGALAAGLVLGWSSCAGKDGIFLIEAYNMTITPDEFSWIGSTATLGAAAICVPIGILCDMIGRKTSMLVLVVPFTVGWVMIIWSQSVVMFYIGRFITGLSGGAFCVTAPLYTSETSEAAIRGSLGSYFQLMLTGGILLSYILGATVKNMFYISLISAVVPLVFFAVFIFMPETPTYYLKKNNEEAARQSLIKLRGDQYNVEPELQLLKESLEEAVKNKIPLASALKSKATKKGLVIAFGLMLFQQLSGVNAIIFYVGSIFADAQVDSDTGAISVGILQVVAVFVSTLIVDKLGRRLLLLTSGVAMCLTTFTLGLYFYLQKQHVESINWLALVSVCVFIVIFSLGFGPIPWMMMSEIFSNQVKSIAGSSACLFNWLMAFVVTKFFSNLTTSLGIDVTFWIFSVICAIGIFFVFSMVVETKGKTLDEIQIELGGDSPTPRHSTNA